jgi:hypothetical protein
MMNFLLLKASFSNYLTPLLSLDQLVGATGQSPLRLSYAQIAQAKLAHSRFSIPIEEI